MDNPKCVDHENIPLLRDEDRDNDYDDYNTPEISIIQVFTDFDTMETTSSLQLTQKVRRVKLGTLHRHLNVKVDSVLTDIDRFRLKKN